MLAILTDRQAGVLRRLRHDHRAQQHNGLDLNDAGQSNGHANDELRQVAHHLDIFFVSVAVIFVSSILEHELLIEQACFVETPRGAIVKIEVAIGTEVFAREELSIRAGNQAGKLLVRQRFELLRCDGLADSEFGSIHRGSVGPRRASTPVRAVRTTGSSFGPDVCD